MTRRGCCRSHVRVKQLRSGKEQDVILVCEGRWRCGEVRRPRQSLRSAPTACFPAGPFRVLCRYIHTNSPPPVLFRQLYGIVEAPSKTSCPRSDESTITKVRFAITHLVNPGAYARSTANHESTAPSSEATPKRRKQTTQIECADGGRGQDAG